MLGITAVLVATPLAAVHYQAAIRDPDTWWRLRVGQYILGTHSFPHMAVFSRFAATNTWETHSWLFDVMVWLVYHWFSLPGLAVLLFVFQIAIAAILFASLSKIGRSRWMAVCLTGLCFAACFHTMAPRAVLFTIPLFIVELALIFHDLAERRIRAMYWLPLLFCVWANCHIQFMNGLLVLGLLFGCEFIQAFVGRRLDNADADLPWIKVLFILCACVAATLLNPYTWHLYEVIWGYATKTGQWDQIVELLAPDFRRPAHYIEVLLAGGAAWALGSNRTRSLFRVAVLAMCAIIAMHAVREAWMIATVAVFLLAETWRRTDAPEPFDLKLTAVGAALALVICVAAQVNAGFTNQKLIAELDRWFPVRAVSYIADTRPPGPIYNSMNWGGYLVFNLREYPVSIDGRNEAYGGDIAYSLNVLQGMPGWKQDPSFAASNLVLVERNLPLAGILAQDSDFQLVYEDHIARVFVRTRR